MVEARPDLHHAVLGLLRLREGHPPGIVPSPANIADAPSRGSNPAALEGWRAREEKHVDAELAAFLLKTFTSVTGVNG